tara:strand:- start:1714 stop:2511 length:798 start_codon:yes stop_codon:yes gene_type:complete
MNLKNIIKYISPSIIEKPKIGVILGSGLNFFTNLLDNQIVIPYNEIPSFYKTNVKGHKGEFIYGKINNIPIICARGRFHYYEGYTFNQVGSIVSIFNALNTDLCIITNSSGCLDTKWDIGSLMLSNKIIDFSFMNSIKHVEYKFEKTDYTKLAKDTATNNKIKLYEGPYVYTTGPSYETAAEIQEIISLGGKAVGMSTFPEYLKCIELKQKFLIISCLTNYGAGLNNSEVSHKDVLLNANKAKKIFSHYLSSIIQNIELQKILKK